MEAAIQITEGQKPLTDVEKELWDIHHALFGVMGMLRMVRASATYSEDLTQTAADISEVSDQYVGIVKNLQDRLEAALCKISK